jgi:hypothetical protein
MVLTPGGTNAFESPDVADIDHMHRRARTVGAFGHPDTDPMVFHEMPRQFGRQHFGPY